MNRVYKFYGVALFVVVCVCALRHLPRWRLHEHLSVFDFTSSAIRTYALSSFEPSHFFEMRALCVPFLFVVCIWTCLLSAEVLSSHVDSIDQDIEKSSDESSSDDQPSEVAHYNTGSSGRDLGGYIESTVANLSSGFRLLIRCLSAAVKAAGNLSRSAVSRAAKSVLLKKSSEMIQIMKNKTSRESIFVAACSVAVSAYSKAPDIVKSAAVALDSAAQYSVEVRCNASSQGLLMS